MEGVECVVTMVRGVRGEDPFEGKTMGECAFVTCWNELGIYLLTTSLPHIFILVVTWVYRLGVCLCRRMVPQHTS